MVGASTYEQLIQLLTDARVTFTLYEYGQRRVADVQEEPPFPLAWLVKTLVFQVDGSWVLAGLRARDRLDYRKLADTLGVKRQALLSPPPEEVAGTLGVEPGAVTPFPLHDRCRVLLDNRAAALEMVCCGAGQVGKTLAIAGPDLLRLSRAEVADIARV